jgi:hypothetical protein
MGLWRVRCVMVVIGLPKKTPPPLTRCMQHIQRRLASMISKGGSAYRYPTTRHSSINFLDNSIGDGIDYEDRVFC